MAPIGDSTITRIVDDISGLTLLQAADLVSLLKVRDIVTQNIFSFIRFISSHD